MKTLRDPKRKPTHPGEMLREDVLPALKMTQAELARRLGVSRLSVSELLHEKRALSPDMAIRIATLTNTTPESWLRMQQALDLWELKHQPKLAIGVTRHCMGRRGRVYAALPDLPFSKQGRDSPAFRAKKIPTGKSWDFVKWWRRRESNPRPQVLRLWFYMRSQVFGFNRLLPDRQGRQTASPVCFSESASDKLHRDLVRVDP